MTPMAGNGEATLNYSAISKVWGLNSSTFPPSEDSKRELYREPWPDTTHHSKFMTMKRPFILLETWMSNKRRAIQHTLLYKRCLNFIFCISLFQKLARSTYQDMIIFGTSEMGQFF